MLLRRKRKKGKRNNHPLKYFQGYNLKAPVQRRLFLLYCFRIKRIKHKQNRIEKVIWFN